MEEVSSYLDMQITAPAMGMKQVVSEEQMTRMLDLLYADLEFLQEKNISVRVRWNENTLWLLPKSNNENEAVRFTDLTENKMLGAWREKVFYYHSGDLEKAWNDAHDTSDGKSPKENGRMVKEVNATQVAPADLLSDKVQYYDRAAKTLGRKQEKGLLERLAENKAQVKEQAEKAPKEKTAAKQEPSL